MPPTDEQGAIGRILDHWNGRFEKAIWAKRRVIARLQGQKHAIIHRAVTGKDEVKKIEDEKDLSQKQVQEGLQQLADWVSES